MASVVVQWRMELNNYLQARGTKHLLTSNEELEGPENRGTWIAKVICGSRAFPHPFSSYCV